MQIIDYKVPEKVNPYIQDVAELNAAGEGKAGTITVPTKELTKARMLFGKAANAIGKTARLRNTEGDGKPDGNTVLTFTLSPRHKARRGDSETATPEVAPENTPEVAPKGNGKPVK